MPHLPCGIGTHARGPAVPHQDFLDVVGGDAGARHGGTRGDRAQFGRVHVLE